MDVDRLPGLFEGLELADVTDWAGDGGENFTLAIFDFDSFLSLA